MRWREPQGDMVQACHQSQQLFDSVIFLVAPIVNSDDQKNEHQQGGLPVWFFRTERDKLETGIP
jgi:hypothetical protein